MSTEVDPPDRTDNPGNSCCTAAASIFFFAPVGSQAFLAATGAVWPSAEKVICDPRSSRIGPQVSEQMREFVGDLPGVSAVHPKMVFDPPWSPEMMTEDAKFALGF